MLWAALTLCCRTGLSDGYFAKSDLRYHVGDVPAGFHSVTVADNDVAFASDDSGHSIAVNATCDGHGDPSLEVLTQHVLMGFTERSQIESRLGQLDGRESLRTRLRASMDGVPVELDLVVLKKNGCVFDFTYLSPVGMYDKKREPFERLLAEFRTETRR